MTPQEKAKDLVNKFNNIIPRECDGLENITSEFCALIAVEEMMLVLPFTDKHKSLNEYAIQMQKYLNQVKHEIEKL